MKCLQRVFNKFSPSKSAKAKSAAAVESSTFWIASKPPPSCSSSSVAGSDSSTGRSSNKMKSAVPGSGQEPVAVLSSSSSTSDTRIRSVSTVGDKSYAKSPLAFSRSHSASNMSCVTSDDCAINELLEGRMELTVSLPSGTLSSGESTVIVNTERRTPMMDLLVNIATQYRFNAANYKLSVEGHEFKASTPIGSLDVNQITVVAKKSKKSRMSNKSSTLPNQAIHNSNSMGNLSSASSSASSVPFQPTFRLQVYLPRNQLMVLRVAPHASVAQIKQIVCEEKNLVNDRFQLVSGKNTESTHPLVLDPEKTLAFYATNEMTLMSINKIRIYQMQYENPTASGSASAGMVPKKAILSLLQATNNQISAPHNDREAINDRKQQAKPVKKRPAPPPPSLPREVVAPEKASEELSQHEAPKKRPESEPNVHMRQDSGSDSSGYHESVLSSDCPEYASVNTRGSHTLGPNVKLNPEAAGPSSSTSNKNPVAVKKRKAPPPPVRQQLKESTECLSDVSVPLSSSSSDSSAQTSDYQTTSYSSLNRVTATPSPIVVVRENRSSTPKQSAEQKAEHPKEKIVEVPEAVEEEVNEERREKEKVAEALAVTSLAREEEGKEGAKEEEATTSVSALSHESVSEVNGPPAASPAPALAPGHGDDFENVSESEPSVRRLISSPKPPALDCTASASASAPPSMCQDMDTESGLEEARPSSAPSVTMSCPEQVLAPGRGEETGPSTGDGYGNESEHNREERDKEKEGKGDIDSHEEQIDQGSDKLQPRRESKPHIIPPPAKFCDVLLSSGGGGNAATLPDPVTAKSKPAETKLTSNLHVNGEKVVTMRQVSFADDGHVNAENSDLRTGEGTYSPATHGTGRGLHVKCGNKCEERLSLENHNQREQPLEPSTQQVAGSERTDLVKSLEESVAREAVNGLESEGGLTVLLQTPSEDQQEAATSCSVDGRIREEEKAESTSTATRGEDEEITVTPLPPPSPFQNSNHEEDANNGVISVNHADGVENTEKRQDREEMVMEVKDEIRPEESHRLLPVVEDKIERVEGKERMDPTHPSSSTEAQAACSDTETTSKPIVRQTIHVEIKSKEVSPQLSCSIRVKERDTVSAPVLLPCDETLMSFPFPSSSSTSSKSSTTSSTSTSSASTAMSTDEVRNLCRPRVRLSNFKIGSYKTNEADIYDEVNNGSKRVSVSESTLAPSPSEQRPRGPSPTPPPKPTLASIKPIVITASLKSKQEQELNEQTAKAVPFKGTSSIVAMVAPQPFRLNRMYSWNGNEKGSSLPSKQIRDDLKVRPAAIPENKPIGTKTRCFSQIDISKGSTSVSSVLRNSPSPDKEESELKSPQLVVQTLQFNARRHEEEGAAREEVEEKAEMDKKMTEEVGDKSIEQVKSLKNGSTKLIIRQMETNHIQIKANGNGSGSESSQRVPVKSHSTNRSTGIMVRSVSTPFHASSSSSSFSASTPNIPAPVPPPPPPPPPPPSSSSAPPTPAAAETTGPPKEKSFASKFFNGFKSSANNKTTTTTNAVPKVKRFNSLDAKGNNGIEVRDALLDEIRGFGGQTSLKKISSNTPWQLNIHGKSMNTN